MVGKHFKTTKTLVVMPYGIIALLYSITKKMKGHNNYIIYVNRFQDVTN